VVRAGLRGRQRLRGLRDIGILDVVGPDAVPVLEVDPQVLDRLAPQLVLDERQQVGGRPVEALAQDDVVLAHRAERLFAPPRDELGGVPVGGHVDRVHRLPSGPLSREPGDELVVLGGEPGVELARQRGGQVVHARHRRPIGDLAVVGLRCGGGARSRPALLDRTGDHDHRRPRRGRATPPRAGRP
jgi:hypothetical protein